MGKRKKPGNLSFHVSGKVIELNPWQARVFRAVIHWFSPLIAQLVARQFAKRHPDWSAQQVRGALLGGMGNPSDPRLREFARETARRFRERPRGAGAAPGSATDYWPSLAALCLANLVPLYGVFAWNWDVFAILVLFWLENLVIGALNLARIVCAVPRDAAAWGGKLFLAPFFCIHYGMFALVHGVFIFALFGEGAYDGLGGGLWNPGAAVAAIRDYGLELAVLILAGSHGFSFAWNYLGRGEYKRASLHGLMTGPYARVIALHLTVLFGGFLVMALGSPVWALVLLVGLKLGMDARAHLKEHHGLAAPTPAETPGKRRHKQ